MTSLYANPYDLSAVGFYFCEADDYAAKATKLRNSHGDPGPKTGHALAREVKEDVADVEEQADENRRRQAAHPFKFRSQRTKERSAPIEMSPRYI